MKRLIAIFILALSAVSAFGQAEVIRLYEGRAPGCENWTQQEFLFEYTTPMALDNPRVRGRRSRGAVGAGSNAFPPNPLNGMIEFMPNVKRHPVVTRSGGDVVSPQSRGCI